MSKPNIFDCGESILEPTDKIAPESLFILEESDIAKINNRIRTILRANEEARCAGMRALVKM